MSSCGAVSQFEYSLDSDGMSVCLYSSLSLSLSLLPLSIIFIKQGLSYYTLRVLCQTHKCLHHVFIMCWTCANFHCIQMFVLQRSWSSVSQLSWSVLTNHYALFCSFSYSLYCTAELIIYISSTIQHYTCITLSSLLSLSSSHNWRCVC